MGGTPSRGTPADQRLADNSDDDNDTAGDSGSTDDDGDSGLDAGYHTLMPWAHPR